MYNNKIKPLQKCFFGLGETKGFKFHQLRSANKVFLYEVDTGSIKFYEVFRKVINRRFACISYPRSKSFGRWAWCFTDKIKAEIKFNVLNNE